MTRSKPATGSGVYSSPRMVDEDREDTKRRHKLLAAMRVPAIALGVLLVPICFYLFHVSSKTEYLTNRNSRLLAVLSDQIASRMDSYRSIIASADDEHGPGFDLQNYLARPGFGLTCIHARCENDEVHEHDHPV